MTSPTLLLVLESRMCSCMIQAGGQSGKFMTEEMLKLGKYKVTAISRADSTNTVPEGCEIRKIDYANPTSIVDALKGHDALVITMNTRAPPEYQTKLIEAAAEANVPWVLPNEYGYDILNPGLHTDIAPIGEKHKEYREHIEKLGKSSWIGVTCGFWYEYSLSFGLPTFGFDFKNRTVTFIDDGNTKINTSTFRQVGRGIANLLALKVQPDHDDDESPCLAHYKNKFVYVSSFRVSQKDVLDSVMRVTGTQVQDWTIKHEPSTSRYKAGLEAMYKGDFTGFAQMMYSRVFYQDGSGDFETSKGLQNEVLGLPKEDLDEATKVAIQMAQK